MDSADKVAARAYPLHPGLEPSERHNTIIKAVVHFDARVVRKTQQPAAGFVIQKLPLAMQNLPRQQLCAKYSEVYLSPSDFDPDSPKTPVFRSGHNFHVRRTDVASHKSVREHAARAGTVVVLEKYSHVPLYLPTRPSLQWPLKEKGHAGRKHGEGERSGRSLNK